MKMANSKLWPVTGTQYINQHWQVPANTDCEDSFDKSIQIWKFICDQSLYEENIHVHQWMSQIHPHIFFSLSLPWNTSKEHQWLPPEVRRIVPLRKNPHFIVIHPLYWMSLAVASQISIHIQPIPSTKTTNTSEPTELIFVNIGNQCWQLLTCTYVVSTRRAGMFTIIANFSKYHFPCIVHQALGSNNHHHQSASSIFCKNHPSSSSVINQHHYHLSSIIIIIIYYKSAPSSVTNTARHSTPVLEDLTSSLLG